MFCTKCGHNNPEGAAFCSSCGNTLMPGPGTAAPPGPSENQNSPIPPQGAPVPPPPGPATSQNQGGYYASPYMPGYAPVKKKSRTGLIVGLSALGVVLIAAALILLFVWPGFLKSVSVSGYWYSEDRGEALELKDNGSIRVYTTYGTYKGDYEYDSAEGMGVITVDDEEYRFSLDNDDLYVESIGSFVKAGNDFDVDDFLSDMSDIEGAGSSDAGNSGSASQSTNAAVDTTDIQGMWYETTGYAGTLEFKVDGTYDMTVVGYVLTGTYQYDPATASGILYEDLTGSTYEFSLANGMIDVNGAQYTRDYVEQYDWSSTESTE